MREDGHEDDGGVGEEGLEDAAVPAGGEAKQQAREEDGEQCCCHCGCFPLKCLWLGRA